MRYPVEIYDMTEEELQICISNATSKAATWLYGSMADVYLMPNGTIIFDYTKAGAIKQDQVKGIAVCANATELVDLIKAIQKTKLDRDKNGKN